MLEIRTKEERRKRVELLEITERLAETRRELLTQRRIVKNIIYSIAGKEPQKRLGEQEFFLKHSATSDEFIKKLRTKVSKLESQQRGKMAEVIKAKRFKEGLEKLRAEAKRQFIEAQEKLEQKEFDEVARISFARKRDCNLQVQ